MPIKMTPATKGACFNQWRPVNFDGRMLGVADARRSTPLA
jgi:hypothetical protein